MVTAKKPGGVIEKKVGKEFRVCDTCGYDRGFHVSFVEGRSQYEVVLICPQCGQRFKVRWKVKLD